MQQKKKTLQKKKKKTLQFPEWWFTIGFFTGVIFFLMINTICQIRKKNPSEKNSKLRHACN